VVTVSENVIATEAEGEAQVAVVEVEEVGADVVVG